MSARSCSVAVGLWILFLAACGRQEGVPVITRPVTDLTGTLKDSEVESIERKIKAYRKESTNQIAVLIIDSLDDQEVEQYSMKVCERWGGGTEAKDNGVLLLIAKDDHKMRIETGYGLGGKLPDMLCRRILDHEIAPFFKKDEFFEGVDNGVDKIIALTKGEYVADTKTAEAEIEEQESANLILIILLVGVAVVSLVAGLAHDLLGGTVGAAGGGIVGFILLTWPIAIGLVVAGFLWGVFGRHLLGGVLHASAGGSGGSGGSSGGRYSGGGGGFGGGGASGSW